MRKKNNIAALGLCDRLNEMWNAYVEAIQIDKVGDDLPLLARFVIEARKAGFEMDASHVDIALPHDEWGGVVPSQIGDFVDAMSAILDELEE